MYRLIIFLIFLCSFGYSQGQSNGYTIPISSCACESSPNDASTYYFGFYLRSGITQTQGASTIILDKSGTIGIARLQWRSSATVGTNESISIYVRLNNTTDYLIQTVSNTNQTKDFVNTSINIPFVANDYIEIKMVTPTWVTNPTLVGLTGWLFINPTP